MMEFMAKYAHSERDTVEIANPRLMAEAAAFLASAVRAVAELVA